MSNWLGRRRGLYAVGAQPPLGRIGIFTLLPTEGGNTNASSSTNYRRARAKYYGQGPRPLL
jgi:hypothetical protein